jgi:hypothetical protein
MYRVRFAPKRINPHLPHQELNCERVYSENMYEIQQFLQAHHFDMNQTIIENVGPDDMKEDLGFEAHVLKEFRLWSNQDQKEYTIYTSNHLMTMAMDYAANEIGQFSLFGETILRRDIQIVNIAATCIANLPCCEVLDYLLLDDNSADDCSWMSVKKCLDDFDRGDVPDWNANDIGYIFELISDESKIGEIQPVTLEAYVESFVMIIKENPLVYR